MLYLLLAVGAYIICGIFAYGLEKGYWRTFFEEKVEYVGYNRSSEAFCMVGVLGPLGLIAELVFLLAEREKPRLCFKMPKELTDKERRKVFEAKMNAFEERRKVFEAKMNALEESIKKMREELIKKMRPAAADTEEIVDNRFE